MAIAEARYGAPHVGDGSRARLVRERAATLADGGPTDAQAVGRLQTLPRILLHHQLAVRSHV